MKASSLIWRGRLPEARSVVGDVFLDWTFVDSSLAFFEGDWAAAEASLNRSIELATQRSSAVTGNSARYLLANIARLRGDYDRARALKKTDLDMAVEYEWVWPEVTDRSLVAEVEAQAGRLEEAEAHVARCRELLARDDHGGKAGIVARVEGRIAAARGRIAEADGHFARAAGVFDRVEYVLEHAQTLHAWGKALLDAGDQKRAAEKLGGALDLYRRHGAGAVWIEGVLVDKMAAQGIDPTSIETSIDAVCSALRDERIDLRGHASADGTVAILFSDIEGSTVMAERLGDERWLAVLRRHNEIVREHLPHHRGTEVKSLGDGFMLAFPTGADAVAFASAVQRDLAKHNRTNPDEPIRIRVGVHAGEAIREGEDFFGKTVILAARIAAEARGGEILVSGSVRAGIGDTPTEEPRRAELKGLSGQHDLHRVAWTA